MVMPMVFQPLSVLSKKNEGGEGITLLEVLEYGLM
jgi:hypothetical protein